jgi:putative ABC transport system permease protein
VSDVTRAAGRRIDLGGRDPLWARAPLALGRYPRLLVSLWTGAVLLAFAAAAYPLMLSARTARLIHDRIADPAVTRFGAGITYAATLEGRPLRYTVDVGPPPEEIERAFAERVSDPALGAVVATRLGPTVSLEGPGGAPSQGRLFSGDGAFDHVALVDRPVGEGVWLADITARVLHLGAGDAVTIVAGGRAARVRVAAVYRARVGAPRSGYWQAWNQEIYPKCTNECPVPPPFVLASAKKMTELVDRLGLVGVSYAWQSPIAAEPGLEDARRVAALADALQAEAGMPGAAIACCRPIELDGAVLMPRLASAMPAVVDRVNAEMAGIAGPGRLLQVTALAVALVVVATAATAGHAARRTELRLLFSRGASTASVAARAALEAVAPAAAGGVVGLALGLAVVPLFGEGARASTAATTSAVVGALAAVVTSVAVVGVVSAIAFARHDEAAHRGLRLAARVPWEVAIGGLAALAYARLRSGGAFIEQPVTGIRVPSLAVLLFPVLAIAAAGTLAARLAVLAVASARERTDRWPSPAFLAARRLTADAGSSIAFIAAAAACLGVFVMAQTIVGSLRETVDAKSALFVGSDVHGTVAYDAPSVTAFPLPITRVTRVPAAATLVPDGAQVDLLAVEPRTLAGAAFWRADLSDTSIERIASLLANPAGDELPVLVAGREGTFAALDVGGTDVPIRVVATASAFPGMSSGRPLVVVATDAFEARFAGASNPLRSPGASTQLWVRGPTGAAVSALRGLRYPPDTIVTADGVADIPHIAIVVGTFALLEVLGLLAALLVIATVLLYLQARQRGQLVSYGLSVRMGLSDARQRRSMLAEVLAALGVALTVGVAVAVAVSIALLPLLDPIPSIAPPPFLDLPVVRIVAILAVVAFVAWLAARLTNRAARSADMGQVMRGVD